MNVDFKLTIPLEKSERADGWYIRGIAAGSEPDLEGDVLTPNCISKFAAQINESPVPFKDWHATNTILSDMGQVEKAWLESGSQLGVEIKLDEDHPGAQYLWRSLAKGKQYGLSVEGGIQQYEYDTARKSNSGRFGRNIDEVILREISATTKPIYTPSFGTVLRKAIDEAEQAKSVPEGDNTVDTVTPQADGTQNPQPPAADSAAPAIETVVVETPEVEKAVSADTARDAKKLTKFVTMVRDMNALIADLGLDGGAIADTTAVSETTTDTAKSTDEAKSAGEFESLVKSFTETTDALKAEIESLKDRIPATQGPAVLQKSEQEEADEVLKALRSDPRLALRAALAVQHGEAFKG